MTGCEATESGTAPHTTGTLPLVQKLVPAPNVFETAVAFADCPDVILFESVLHRPPVGRFSFLSAKPVRFWQLQQPCYKTNPFSELRDVVRQHACRRMAGLPPFQGGLAGLLSYELGGCFERIPLAAGDEFQLPVLAVGLYDWVIAWDHQTNESWLICHGIEPKSLQSDADRAKRQHGWVMNRLQQSAQVPSNWQMAKDDTMNVSAEQLVSRWRVAERDGWTSNFSRETYLKTVQRVIDYVRAGDIFQANLSQRLLHRFESSAWNLYARLRRVNPAPFAGLFTHADWAVVSASPERFVRLQQREVETRPIKGTRPRCQLPEADLFTRDVLRQSDKDLAENVMIADLLRNDLSRVCRPGSIRVPQLCGVELYETVQHLVSVVQGTLLEEHDAFDLLRAVFPGGSITGAPKIRAMQIIAELEPTVRGPYCGSLFYLGFNGDMDSNILIRTLVHRGGWVQCSVGGGIVAQSDPAAEYTETLDKAVGMLAALNDR